MGSRRDTSPMAQTVVRLRPSLIAFLKSLTSDRFQDISATCGTALSAVHTTTTASSTSPGVHCTSLPFMRKSSPRSSTDGTTRRVTFQGVRPAGDRVSRPWSPFLRTTMDSCTSSYSPASTVRIPIAFTYRLGAPANPFGHLMPWIARQSQLVRPVGSPNWIPAEMWGLIHAEAIRQCDALDGVCRIRRRCSWTLILCDVTIGERWNHLESRKLSVSATITHAVIPS